MRPLFALALLLPVAALAKSPFDGSWKTKLDSLKFEGKPDVYELANGSYSCASCAPPYKIKADGTDQKVPGHAYLDTEAVKVTGPASIELTDKKDGKLAAVSTASVSADGSTMTGKFTSYAGDKPFSGGFSEKRIAKGPPGSHPISGSWQQDRMTDLSDGALVTVLQSTPGGLKMSWNGQTTDANFDGKEYATSGDPGKTMVALKKISEHQIEETDRRQGQVVDIIVWTVAADGKTLTTVDTDPVHGTKTTQTMEKQP